MYPGREKNSDLLQIISGNVIPVVYAKLISRKGTVYNTTKCV